MVCSLLSHANRARTSQRGLPYVVIDDALPEDYYAELVSAFPDESYIAGGTDFGTDKVHRRSARNVIGDEGLPAVWRDFFMYHTSQSFFDEVCAVWQDEIAQFHPKLELTLGKPLESFTVDRRFPGKANNPHNQASDIVLDCQFSINRSVEEENTVRGPHLDSPYKLFAGLFYMRTPTDTSTGGDLEFFRLKKGKYPRPKPGRIDPREVENVELIPYAANTLVMFLNSPLSIHGVTPRSVCPEPRRYINLLGECYKRVTNDFFTTPEPSAPYWYRRLREHIVQYT